MTHLRLAVAVAVLVVLAALPRRADAQLWNASNGTTWNNPMSSLASTMITNQMYEHALNDSFARPGGAAPAAPVRHQPIASTDFMPNGKRVMVGPIVSSLAATPELRDGLTRGVDQVFGLYEQKARRNNVAYAMAFMLAAAVNADKGVQMTDTQIANLATALNDQLAASPGFANASALDRQKVYETFVTLGALIVLFDEVGKHDAASASIAKQLAATAFKLFHPAA